LTFFPRKGFEINALDEKNIQDLFELRLVLETAVMRHITPEISEASIFEEHHTIIDMLKKRDAEGAVAMMVAHLKITEKETLAGQQDRCGKTE